MSFLLAFTLLAPGQKLAPAEAAKSFTTPADLRFEQVLAEPVVRQPVSLSFDERGRMWVVQYLTYPDPAGLKAVSRDAFWRTVYDKVPAPPPHHVRGQDRITIHEDTDGDGVYDKHSTFVDGLSIVTAAVRGRGGVWVLNPPYLLYYPTKDNADAPTGDPVVHLQGFGLEDTHSCANSLRWGPDGWLYGAHGSTVTAQITRPGAKDKAIPMIGQHIWRYHPEKKRFEVFAEGGGNAFGVEFDQLGNLYSGHNGGNTRGFHYVQGGYYLKGFDKHGTLSNPYAFGHFPAMKSPDLPRFSHTFVIDEAPGLPARYRGQLFAVAPMQGQITLSDVLPDGSSFRTRDLEPVVRSNDRWYRPVDIKPGPDGALYVADFYEDSITHRSHYAGQVSRDTGRIYRLAAADAQPRKAVDLGHKTTPELIELLRSDNRWVRETVQRLLADRRDGAALPLLRPLLRERGQLALEALWALNASDGFDETTAEIALPHETPAVRAWAIRLLADDFTLGKLAAAVAERARTEGDVHVRSQAAASARRLPAAEGLPLVRGLLRHDEDAADVHIPLLLWWALEAQCGEQRAAVLDLFRDSTLWNTKIAEQAILARLMRRFALAGSQRDFQTCTELFRLAPERRHGLELLKGFEEAFQGRSSTGLPPELLAEIGRLGGGSLAFAVRLGQADALDKAFAVVQNPKAKAAERVPLIELLGETRPPRTVAVLLALLHAPEPDAIRKAALGSLQAFSDEAIGAEVVKLYPQLRGEVRETAETLLTSRRAWSMQLLGAVDAGKIEPRTVSLASVRTLLLGKDAKVTELVRKHWGDVKGGTTVELQREVDRLADVVAAGKGDPYPGKVLFTKSCASCHTLHSHGGAVGPDLTPYKRDDIRQMLLHIVNPSAEIREGYENHVVVTESGRTLTGVVAEKDARVLVLKTSDGQRVVVPRADVAEASVIGMSLMPEGLLQGLSEQEVRDLFAYLRSTQPLNEPRK